MSSTSNEPPIRSAPVARAKRRTRSLGPRLEDLEDRKQEYAKASRSKNTQKAYEADWRDFLGWLQAHGREELPPDPGLVGSYLTALVSPGQEVRKPVKVTTLERRLCGIAWHYRQLGAPLHLADPDIATVMAGIRRVHAAHAHQKEAVLGPELIAMLATHDQSLRGLRDRAILAVGFCGGLRRSEIVGLDCGEGETIDGSGWIEILPPTASSEGGLLLRLKGKTGLRMVEIGRGSTPQTCPVTILETWLHFSRISHGPLFRRISKRNHVVGASRLAPIHVARLVKRTALAAGLRVELAEDQRHLAYGAHSLRAGLASSAEAEESHIQKQLGHATPQMTRLYQRRRERFRVNLTKASGL